MIGALYAWSVRGWRCLGKAVALRTNSRSSCTRESLFVKYVFRVAHPDVRFPSGSALR